MVSGDVNIGLLYLWRLHGRGWGGLKICQNRSIVQLFIFADGGGGWGESKNWTLFVDFINEWPLSQILTAVILWDFSRLAYNLFYDLYTEQ